MDNLIFQRTELLLGEASMHQISEKRVIIFGIGGVGSWCAESLIRSGIIKLTIVDSDCVSITNLNRQAMATTSTIGRPKVEALRERLLDINSMADINIMMNIYSKETAHTFHLESYDYVIDAIDSLSNKADLILHATSLPVKFFSSMGAALKLDITRIKVAEFWQVKGCPLGAALRRRFKRMKSFPKHKFQCIYSDELLPNKGNIQYDSGSKISSQNNEITNEHHNWDLKKAQINGTVAHITAIFGFMLAGLVISDAVKSE